MDEPSDTGSQGVNHITNFGEQPTVSNEPPKDDRPIKVRLQEQFPELTEDHFATHESDLYVVALPGVREWLQANYEWACNMKGFMSQKGSNWAGEGKYCLDIPFANADFWEAVERKAAARKANGH